MFSISDQRFDALSLRVSATFKNIHFCHDGKAEILSSLSQHLKLAVHGYLVGFICGAANAAIYAQFEKALDKQVQLMNIEIRYPVTTLMRVLKRIKAPKKASYEAMDYFVAIHGDSPCTAYELFMQMSDVIFSAQCDGASGLRIAQLEEIVSRALNVNWHEYDHPGDFKW